MLSKFISLGAFVSLALAQQPLYGQCGGTGYTGSTVCAVGVCYAYSEWFSQCIPASNVPSSSVASSSAAPSSTAAPVSPKYWFSFGDSYTQTGFDVSLTLPAVGNPLGNPVYPGWTSAGGENWVDFVTTTYNKSTVLTYNFAYGGATIDANLVKPYDPSVKSLTDQVANFLETSGKKPASTPWTSANTLFSIWIGINDIGNSWWLNENGTFSDTLLNAEFALVEKLVNVGARNFLWLNVPAVERSPYFRGAIDVPSQAIVKTVIDGFNTRLLAKAAAFKSSHSGVTTFSWDSYSYFAKILDNPTAYGFKDNTTYGSGSDIFWWNDLHPSTPAHKLFAQQIGNGVLGKTVW